MLNSIILTFDRIVVVNNIVYVPFASCFQHIMPLFSFSDRQERRLYSTSHSYRLKKSYELVAKLFC